MPIIPPTPESVFDCALLKALREKTSTDHDLYEKVKEFISVAAPLNDLTVSGPFRNYTLHNSDHSKKIVHLIGFLLPTQTLGAITALDCLLMIYAAYLHDMAMALTSHEREKIIKSDDFVDQLHASPAIDQSMRNLLKKLDSDPNEQERSLLTVALYELNEALLSEYLRPRHADSARYKELISRLDTASSRKDLFYHRGASFSEALVNVCASHILDAGVLLEALTPYQDRFPRQDAYGGIYLNQQFCAAMLRIADILDFDRERTPQVLFNSLGIADSNLPGADISLKEWQKHLSIHTIELNPLEFVVTGQVNHPVIERAIREFCALIEREVRDTLAILRRNPQDILGSYRVDLPILVRPNLTSVGYIYRDMSLSLNQSRIFSLLMGERLYSSPAVALRELLQNSIDACRTREAFETNNYTPQIDVSDEIDDLGRAWLVVRDNGSGMDEHILSEYFLTLGNSYYKSSEYERRVKTLGSHGKGIVPISRFGIGLASAFLIADVLDVETKSAMSLRGDLQARRLRIEGVLSLAFVTTSSKADAGTQIKLRVKEEFARNMPALRRAILNFLRITMVRPRVPVKVKLEDEIVEFATGRFMHLRPNAAIALHEQELEFFLIDLERWTDRFTGKLGLFFGVDPNGLLSEQHRGGRLKFGIGGIDPRDFLEDYPGNRASVNGFAMSIRGINKAFFGTKAKAVMVYDIEIRGDDDVEYDISRQRVMGKGRMSVIDELKSVVAKALSDTGLVDRLNSNLKDLYLSYTVAKHWVNDGWYVGGKVVNDAELLDKVEAELKKAEHWNTGMHKKIATTLEISNGLASRCITTLLAAGRVAKPASLIDPQ